MVKTGYFISGLFFFIAMTLTVVFTIFLYVKLVIAVRNNSDVPKWMYKMGHALKGRGTDIYQDFTDKSALSDVNMYIIGVILSSIVVYFTFYNKDLPEDAIKFWIFTEFLIIIVMRIVLVIGKSLLSLAFSKIRKSNFDCNFSASANAVIGMFLMSIFSAILTLNLTGIPAKAPTVQVGEYKIVVGHTKAHDLLSNGFSFTGKKASDIIVNKRDSHFYFGETVELTKDGKLYGYVNLTPKYKDEAKLEDCVITYFGISSKSQTFDDIKICDKNISTLSLNDFKNKNMRDIFSLSPPNYRESKGNEHFLLVLQTYPYVLWKRYTIETIFFDEGKTSQFEVYAQHTIWE